MGMFTALTTSASGLSAQRLRMDAIADNLANVNTTRTDHGGPYRRKIAVFGPIPNQGVAESPFLPNVLKPRTGQGVRVTAIEESDKPFNMVYNPHHPDRIQEGKWKDHVAMPNVNIVEEMVDMISASRAYEANIAVIQDGKSMFTKALDIAR